VSSAPDKCSTILDWLIRILDWLILKFCDRGAQMGDYRLSFIGSDGHFITAAALLDCANDKAAD